MKKYNHMFDVAFTVNSDKEDWVNITLEELMEGLIKRLPDLYHDGAEVFGFCDTIDNSCKQKLDPSTVPVQYFDRDSEELAESDKYSRGEEGK